MTVVCAEDAGHHQDDGGREQVVGIKVAVDCHAGVDPELGEEAVGAASSMDACIC